MSDSLCKSCGARIIWAVSANGRAMPLDHAPASLGKFSAQRDGETIVAVYIAERQPTSLTGHLYTCHFATCPNASHHRKRQPRPVDPGKRSASRRRASELLNRGK